MINSFHTLYWLIDIETYDFTIDDLSGLDLRGKALIVSSYLWSIKRGTQHYSILIGPGIFKGVATKDNIHVDVFECISCLMFDPTQLRYDEPLPLVDIFTAEVIDPLGTKKMEHLITDIENLVNRLEREKFIRLGIPQIVPDFPRFYHRINLSFVSGLERAKFYLGKSNGDIYRPFAKNFPKLSHQQIERTRVLATPFCKFTNFSDIEVMSDWMIVEKAGPYSKTGMEAIGAEYERTLGAIEKDKDNYIFEL